jgi:hypothetical protein
MTPNRLLITASLLAASALNGGPALAQRAVEATNFELAIDSNDNDTSGSTSTGTLGANLRGTLPIGGFLGVSLTGGYSTSRVRTGDVLPREDGTISVTRPSCSFDNLDGELSFFARRPTLGRIGLSYGVGELSSDCSVNSQFLLTGSDKLDTDRQRLDLEVYLSDFTIGGAYTQLNLDSGPELETTALHASWYPLDSLKITLSGDDQYEENTYGIQFEHQPEFLGDGFGVQLGYAKTDGDLDTQVISVGLSYFFGTRVTLKDRDRLYR